MKLLSSIIRRLEGMKVVSDIDNGGFVVRFRGKLN
jgi:hypothetical protein